MKKKVISLLLAVAMTSSLIACGNTSASDNGADVSEEKQQSSASVQESAQSSEEVPAEKNYYGFDEPITIKVGFGRGSTFSYKGGESALENSWMDLYRENNINCELLYEVDDSQSATKRATAIMSGNYPDILSAGSSDFVEWAETGVIADITDVYEEFATEELKAYVNADGGLSKDYATIDGKMYAIPLVGNPYDQVYIMWIRQDWLNNLNLEIPDTMEELKEVAYAFTYNDPDQNGKNDTYGLGLNGTNLFASGIGNATAFFGGFGAHLGQTGSAFVEYEEGKVTWGGTNAEGMKAGLQMLQDMYKEGSIAKDFITMDGNSVTEETGAGRCGIWFGPMWGGWTPQSEACKADPNAQIVAAPVPDGLDQGGSKAYFGASVSTFYCVSSKCENPEVLIKLANLSVQKLIYPESSEEFAKYRGDEIEYTGVKCSLTNTEKPFKNYNDYKVVFSALRSGKPEGLSVEQLQTYNQISKYYEMRDAGKILPEDPDYNTGIGINTVFGDPQCAFVTIEMLENSERFIPSAYNSMPTESMNEYQGTLAKLATETMMKIILGDYAVDKYDEFLETWYSQGGQEMIDDAQAWFDKNK